MGGWRIAQIQIGVMQGRLLPKYNGHYQAHPVDYWEDEFPIASTLGLSSIEFILDYNGYKKNPLLTKSGRQKIKSITDKTGVKVLSVCADYFMESPLHSKCERSVQKSIEVLYDLMDAAVFLGIKDIVIPCVDKASILSPNARSRFINVIQDICLRFEKNNINLSLETDLGPTDFANILETINSRSVTVNYDIGNSASLGYNYKDELSAYGFKITDIHIKDRFIGGSSVLLGDGDADIKGFMKDIKKYNYSGQFIMQAYRDEKGLNIFKEQFNWFKKNIV
tara:strand:- start:217 stop:1056 length:840 start_codon:yes stop_codon:yes gene_type:complete